VLIAKDGKAPGYVADGPLRKAELRQRVVPIIGRRRVNAEHREALGPQRARQQPAAAPDVEYTGARTETGIAHQPDVIASARSPRSTSGLLRGLRRPKSHLRGRQDHRFRVTKSSRITFVNCPSNAMVSLLPSMPSTLPSPNMG
jgi:hypothetical protein